jgi:Bacterial self-protective colicin-like immunity
MLQEEREALAPYLTLIRDFVGGRITAAEFDDRYQERYLADARSWSEDTFEILDRLFADVDFFVEDDDKRDSAKGDLDAAGLSEAARRALDGLSALTRAG